MPSTIVSRRGRCFEYDTDLLLTQTVDLASQRGHDVVAN